jgi:glycosyltransferase involved in cell wall biosynthesis
VQHERTGLLVPPEDSEALARALERLLGDPALARRLGAAGPERIRDRYDAEAMVAGYERIYGEILAGEATS